MTRTHLPALVLVAALSLPREGVSQGADTREGVRLFEARDYAAARARLQAAARADAKDATAALYLGRLELVDGDAGAAVRYLERAAALAPRSAVTQLFLGTAYGRQAARASKFRLPGLARRTRTALEAAVAIDPTSVDARDALLEYYAVAPRLAGGSPAKAREQAREIARLNPMRGRLAEGAIAEAGRDLGTAEQKYRLAEREYPDSAAPYLLLGAMLQRAKRYDEAVREYDRLLARRDEAAAHYQVGRALALAGVDLARAERELTGYLGGRPRETDPSQSSAHYYLGLARERRGDSEGARGEYRATLQLDPGRAEAREALRRVGAGGASRRP